ncbi:uncharacterized mitochondrial protein-like protein [Tanacetum coccineum]
MRLRGVYIRNSYSDCLPCTLKNMLPGQSIFSSTTLQNPTSTNDLSIKVTRVQHQQEVNELIENIDQKTYAYGDVRAKNQDLFMTISKLQAKLKLAEKGKNVNTKFDKSVSLEKLIRVTPLNKNKDLKAKIVSKVEVKTNKSKPVTSCSTPKNEQGQKKNENVIVRGMYRVTKTKTQTPVAKTNKFSCNSTRVANTSSVSRSESKDTKSKKRVLLNTKSKSTSKDVKKSQSSFTSVVNKKDTMNLNSKKSFIYLLVVAKSSKLGATPAVAKSRFNVATPPKSTNKVSHASSQTPESRQSWKLSSYMKNKNATSKKWQKWFEHKSSFNWSPKSSTTQKPPRVSKSSPSARTNSKTPVTTQKWVAKLSTPSSEFVLCDAAKFRWLAKTLRDPPNEPPLRIYQRWKNTIYEDALRKSDQMHQTFEKRPLALARKLDGIIELPKLQPKRTYKEDLECEMVMVKMPRCMSFLGSTDAYDEPISSLGMMNNEVGNTCSQSTPQVLPLFVEYIPPMTYPEEVEETLGTPIEVGPLDQLKLENVGLTNHNISLSSRKVPSFDELKPQPQAIPNCPPLDISLGDEISPEPPIKPHSPDSFRMKEVGNFTIHTSPSPHIATFHSKDIYFYHHPCIDDLKKHYGFKLVYSFKINLVPSREFWAKSQVPSRLIPPYILPQVGRPGKKRNKSVGEVTEMVKDGKLTRKGGTVTCCKCGQKGHNKRSCKGPSFVGSRSTSGATSQPPMASARASTSASTSQPARASDSQPARC